MSNPVSHLRVSVLGVVVVSLFATLFTRLWILQVLDVDEYALAADHNRVRVVAEQAPRGRIFDRNGKLLVGNRRTRVVTIEPQGFGGLATPAREALLQRLAVELQRDRWRQAEAAVGGGPGAVDREADRPPPPSVDALRQRMADPRFSRFKPVPVATDVSEDLEIVLTERAAELPTVAVDRVTVRRYPYGRLLAHVLGYVGAVNADEMEAVQNGAKPYDLNDEIGKGGVESAMERDLRGVPGAVRLEVDVDNRPVRTISERAPVPGNDVYLAIDIDLQALTEQSLEVELVRRRFSVDADGERYRAPAGSSVLLDPTNGQVLALASSPTYDPAAFVNGISSAEYRRLTAPELEDRHHHPLTNRALQGQYAPGSTFKLATAYSALRKGVIAPDTTLVDRGTYQIQGCRGGLGSACVKQNAGRDAKGRVDLARALTVSSDVYFYKVGDDFWVRRGEPGFSDGSLQEGFLPLGFGVATGIEVGGEAAGRVPTPAWKQQLAARLAPDDPERGLWRSGDSTNVAIGQGDVLATPMQLANAYATFANGGSMFAPRVVLDVRDRDSGQVLAGRDFTPRLVRQIDLPAEWRQPMLEGFEAVTLPGTGGTASTTFAGFPQDRFPVAAKTGTAQVDDRQDTSLFVAFAPARAPRYVAVAVLEEAGNGGNAAAPTVRRILEPLALGAVPPAPDGGELDVTALAFGEGPPPSRAGD